VQKDTDDFTIFFCAFGICGHKASSKHVGEVNPWSQFYQPIRANWRKTKMKILVAFCFHEQNFAQLYQHTKL
jgi:hypothetical protein